MCGVGFAQQSDTTAPKSAAATRHTPPVDDEKAYRPPAAERAAQPQEAPVGPPRQRWGVMTEVGATGRLLPVLVAALAAKSAGH